MEQLLYSSVEIIPNARASVAFTEPKPVFKEDSEITQTILSDTHCYMLRVGTNQMPFDIIGLIESDDTSIPVRCSTLGCNMGRDSYINTRQK